MKIIEEKNITQNVLAGLDAMSSTRENAIENFAPNFIKKAIKTFAGVKGTEIYNGFKNGNLIYLSKVLQKNIMLQITNLIKHFTNAKAVDGISFSASRGKY